VTGAAKRVVSRQVVEISRASFGVHHGVDAAAAVDGKSTAHRRLENHRAVFHKRPHRSLYAIDAKISWAVGGSAGAESCFIDSTLK
jgi:hypothetical protein